MPAPDPAAQDDLAIRNLVARFADVSRWMTATGSGPSGRPTACGR